MSWYINVIGSPAEVADFASKQEYLPDGLKSVVKTFTDAMAKDPINCSKIVLRSNGHYWADGQCGVNEFYIGLPPSPVIVSTVSTGSVLVTGPEPQPVSSA